MKKQYIRRALIMTILIATLTTCGIGILLYQGILQLNHPSRRDYPIHGVDVSKYQGTIDWEVLATQDIQFAFIKATEGSSAQDPCFEANWENAANTDLRIGAYHFFSYDSAGETQADQFIATVTAVPDMLPPVIDVEFYGDKEKNLPDAKEVTKNLTAMCDKLEEHFGVKPILYATHKSYELFLAADFAQYDIWIRDVITTPTLSDKRDWTFWQYSNRKVLEGYEGTEKFIDMNVFSGSAEEFMALNATVSAIFSILPIELFR